MAPRPRDESPPGWRRGDEAAPAGEGGGGGKEGDGTSLELARLLFDQGSNAVEEGNFVDAVDFLSGALEIRVAHYGEFAPECASTYYKFGCALLCKAQEETDRLGNVPKSALSEESAKSASSKVGNGASKGSASVIEDAPSSEKGHTDQGKNTNDKDQEDGDGDIDMDDDMGEDEDDSDLDLAWKILEVARAIVEKNPDNTMDKVKIFSALAEVSMEREDIGNSLGDYFKALAILEHLVEPEHCRIVELNFRICLVFELASKIGDAIQYCAKAILLCKAHIQSVKNAKDALLSGKDDNTSAVEGDSERTALEDDIELLTGILADLEKKLEDLEQAITTPRSASLRPEGMEGDGTLELAQLLFERGSKAVKEGDFISAVNFLSSALEIRVTCYGQLAPECASTYYKFGCALLCKAQKETDPLGYVLKGAPHEELVKITSSKVAIGGSKSFVSIIEDAPSSEKDDADQGKNSNGKDQKDGDGDTDMYYDMGEDEDDSDLDLAWKMLELARAIVEKSPDNTMEKVKIFSALAEVSMEKEDIDNSLGDYFKALAILEHLVEPEHCQIVELNFRICLVFELASRIGDAIPYCAKAVSLCKSHIQTVKNAKDALLAGKDDSTSAVEGDSEKTALEDDIELLTRILADLEKKLEDLEQAMPTPSSAPDEIMKRIASKASSEQNVANDVPRAASSNGFDSSTMSLAATTGSTVNNLRIAGRGIKRAIVKSISGDPPSKRPAGDSLSVKGNRSGKSGAHRTTQDGDDSVPK